MCNEAGRGGGGGGRYWLFQRAVLSSVLRVVLEVSLRQLTLLSICSAVLMSVHCC